MTAAWKSSAWVDVSHETEAVVLRVCGELDLDSVPIIESVITAAVESCRAITLDLSALTFCDSSGIALLLRASQKAETNSTTMQLCRLLAPVARAFEAAGVDRVLPVVMS